MCMSRRVQALSMALESFFLSAVHLSIPVLDTQRNTSGYNELFSENWRQSQALALVLSHSDCN